MSPRLIVTGRATALLRRGQGDDDAHDREQDVQISISRLLTWLFFT